MRQRVHISFRILLNAFVVRVPKLFKWLPKLHGATSALVKFIIFMFAQNLQCFGVATYANLYGVHGVIFLLIIYQLTNFNLING